jgi:urate oxidase
MLGVVAIGNTLQAGVFTALLEMSNYKTFDIIVKDQASPIEDVRILRSSSSGFILFAKEQIFFVPQGEIRQVRSSKRSPD